MTKIVELKKLVLCKFACLVCISLEKLHMLIHNYRSYEDHINNYKSDETTCIPPILTPSLADVVEITLTILLCLFAKLSSSPYCLVPIFRSKIQGRLNLPVKFSKTIKS